MGTRVLITTAALLLAAMHAEAQNQTGAPQDTPQVDVSRLPIDLQRIHRELSQAAEREEREGLNLRYYVNVTTQAPPVVLFTPEDNLTYGPVPYSAPTHRDMLEQMTPMEFRAPAADLNALFRWLAERAK